MNEEEISSTPPNLLQIADEAVANLLPQKSADLYNKQYDIFVSWCDNQSVTNYSENVFLAYFCEKAKICKSSTLWSIYSMLKSTFVIKHNINISKYSKLIAFIKKQNTGYKPKKSNIFTREDVNKFLIEAPDLQYLMWKVCLIFGVAGASRMDELKKMSIDDVEDKEDALLITIPDSKTGRKRTFTITNKMSDDLNPITIYRKYRSLRPSHTPHKSLFIYYRLGKCSTQPIGIHTFGKIPNQIATYLKLADAKMYTGHSFRRTSASLLADTGSDILTLKQHGGWKSTNVAEGYVESSIARKKEIAERILEGHSSSKNITSSMLAASTSSSTNKMEPITISNNTNCSIVININK